MNDEKKVYMGEVIWFSKGFGFLAWNIDGAQQKDLFVHYSDISMEGFKNLLKGQKVSFEIGKNNHGDPKAINVTALKD